MSTSDPVENSREALREKGPEFKRLYLKSHKDLIRDQAAIFKRVKDNPDLARLLVLNPVIAFEEMGVQASPEMRHHILATIEHPTKVRHRQEELEKRLKDKLGQMPQPNKPEWVSQVLFKDLKLKPLNTKGLKPAYRPPENEALLKRLNNLRPPSRKRYHHEASIPAGSIEVKAWQPSRSHLDLDAAVPRLKTVREVPKRVTLEELFFYKDSHPLARDLLELGVIQRTSFNFLSRAKIRKIREGKTDNALYRWVKFVRFPEGL